jgi:hypothetical protein
MHTCNFMLPGAPGEYVQCQKPAIRSVLLSFYDEYTGYCETTCWLCEEHYADPRTVQAWEGEGWEYAY